MSRFRFTFLAGLAWLLAGCTPAAPAAQAEPALWHIHDADSDIWLFGTVHVLPSGVDWRSARVSEALAAADELVTETDTSPDAVTRFQTLALELGTLPAGQTIFQRLDADTRARLDRVARASNLQPEQFTQTRPWLAALQLSYAYAAAKGHGRENGVETVLLGDAQARAKTFSYLETPEEQVHTLADLSPADEDHFFAVTLRQIEDEAESMDELDQAWARGDTSGLGRELDAQVREAGPAVHNALILDRNRRWADKIQARLNGSGRIFIAVGAAHLVGEGSVVSLLRARGIEVEGP